MAGLRHAAGRPWTGLTGILAVAAIAILPLHAQAATEEFSTFDVTLQEGDDESLLDHYLTRPLLDWRDEWERAPQAIRTSQGCLTSGQWFIDTDLKVNAPLGRRARFELNLRQSESDVSSYDFLDFSFQFPSRWGTPGILFRPLYDKSRQDFALTWELGADTTAFQLRTAFTMEDMFNNLWAFRQTRVGQKSEPYSRHPYEPAVAMVIRQPRFRAELAGQYLTPSVKRLMGPSGEIYSVSSLWGTLVHGSVELGGRGLHLEARTTNQQASSSDQTIADFTGRGRDFRRCWTAETAVGSALTRRITAEARWLYQDRAQTLGPPSVAFFHGIDRMLAFETRYGLSRSLTLRVGALYDRISIVHVGNLPFSYGTRKESRAFLGVMARFGRVQLSGVEGIELDHETYDVWLVHDKGFLQLQATF